MLFLEFKDKMFDLACFTTNQVYAWRPDFDRNNFVRWNRKGLIIRLRQGLYTFPEYMSKPDMANYFANRIYRPSYISLHSALSFYGMIPESVVQITSVSPLKTASFRNPVSTYSYKSVRRELMFGFVSKPIAENLTILIASPEKALLDLLYLYPGYQSLEDFLGLRLDYDFLQNDLNIESLKVFSGLFSSRSLGNRLGILLRAYGL